MSIDIQSISRDIFRPLVCVFGYVLSNYTVPLKLQKLTIIILFGTLQGL